MPHRTRWAKRSCLPLDRVKYAVNTETGERVAIKVLDKEKIQKQNMGAQIKKEISIMKMVRHKHVVVLREVLASRTKVSPLIRLVSESRAVQGRRSLSRPVQKTNHVRNGYI
jgi:serine/threonine protein kinase